MTLVDEEGKEIRKKKVSVEDLLRAKISEKNRGDIDDKS